MLEVDYVLTGDPIKAHAKIGLSQREVAKRMYATQTAALMKSGRQLCNATTILKFTEAIDLAIDLGHQTLGSR